VTQQLLVDGPYPNLLSRSRCLTVSGRLVEWRRVAYRQVNRPHSGRPVSAATG
jgi:hypothetical protein